MLDDLTFEHLYTSMQKCQSGVTWKPNVAHFTLNALEEVSRLERELDTGTYKPRKVTHFKLYCPKERDIACIAFRDRVYQRTLNDRILYPEMTRSFIYDNAACQKGKGTDFARNRLKKFLHEHYRKYSTAGYVAQFDIHSYYPCMDHKLGESLFDEFEPEVRERVLSVLHTQYPNDVGYNPGSQLIQLIGISALNDLDHYIKEQLHIRHYIRFMDDFILIHPDEEYLEQCRVEIIKRLNAKHMTVNEKKTKIYPITNGIPFLGFSFWLSGSGKVFILIDPVNVKRKRKNLVRLIKMCKLGKIDRKTVEQSYQAWRSHAAKGNSYQLLRRMDKYFMDLWR